MPLDFVTTMNINSRDHWRVLSDEKAHTLAPCGSSDVEVNPFTLVWRVPSSRIYAADWPNPWLHKEQYSLLFQAVFVELACEFQTPSAQTQ